MRYGSFLLFFYFVFILGCSHGGKTENTDLLSSVKSKQISPDIRHFFDSYKVHLQDYQLLPTEYLSNHPEIPGLLIYHGIGSGKTYLSLAASERLTSDSVVIIGPSYLQYHWTEHIRNFGCKNPARYTFVSIDDIITLNQIDFSNRMVILDEAHRLVGKLRNAEEKETDSYAEFFKKLGGAKRILALTGTPVFLQESDLAYLLNLVAQKDLLPLDDGSFRKEMMTVNSTRSFWRGHVSESLLVQLIVLPIAAAPLGVFGYPLALCGLLYANNQIFPLSTYKLRYFDVEKLRPHLAKYVSYFSEKKGQSQYATTVYESKKVTYTPAQHRAFYRLASGNLRDEELSFFFEEPLKPHSIKIQKSAITKKIKGEIGQGRQIGNFSIEGEVSPKFTQLLATIGKKRALVYSNYAKSGGELVTEYLKTKGDIACAMVSLDQSAESRSEVIKKFNENQLQVLILHPAIVEGISLVGVRQVHFLEPVLNQTLQQQVVGRAVRFNSHQHLPEAERNVDVYTWVSTLGDSEKILPNEFRKDDWDENYAELNYWSSYGQGRRQLDADFDFKLVSPDEKAVQIMTGLGDSITRLDNELALHASIELRTESAPATRK